MYKAKKHDVEEQKQQFKNIAKLLIELDKMCVKYAKEKINDEGSDICEEKTTPTPVGKKRILKEESKSEQGEDPPELEGTETRASNRLKPSSTGKVKSVRFKGDSKNVSKDNSSAEEHGVLADIQNIADKPKVDEEKKAKTRKKKSSKVNRKRPADENQLEPEPFPACDERKWDDGKDKKMVTGAFSDREIILLRNAICEYGRENELTSDDLKSLIDESSKEKPYSKAWTEIAKALRKLTIV